MTEAERPTQVIYGLYNYHESLCLFEARRLQRISAEVVAVQACTTVGQIEELLPTLSIYVPAYLEELDDDTPPETPWSWADMVAVQEGDWPAMPTSEALELFERGDPIWPALVERVDVEVVTTVMNGDYLFIPPEKENELVVVLREHGIEAWRDDALIEPLCLS